MTIRRTDNANGPIFTDLDPRESQSLKWKIVAILLLIIVGFFVNNSITNIDFDHIPSNIVKISDLN